MKKQPGLSTKNEAGVFPASSNSCRRIASTAGIAWMITTDAASSRSDRFTSGSLPKSGYAICSINSGTMAQNGCSLIKWLNFSSSMVNLY